MTIRISSSARSAAADGVVDQVDVGAGVAKLQLRTGGVPANLTDAASGTLLAEFDLPNPAFGAAAAGVATANAISGTTGLAAGTVGHFRVIDRDGTIVEDSASVGVGSGELQLNTLEISVGVDVAISAWSISMPAS